MTRVMFVADGEPLSGVRVRAGGDDLWTNDEGFVEVPLVEGEHVLAVERVEGDWLNASVAVSKTSGIVVADVSVVKPSTGMFATAQLAGVRSQSFGDRYTFERVLGRGGMGVVVKALDTLLERPVAIKMLTEEFEDNEEAQNIFLTEARSIATLAHPNLVAVYDVAMIDERAMIVFEFVEGSNLEDVFSEHGTLREGEMLRVGIQLGSALAYLHGQGVIHRDLKPGNAIVQSDGAVRLIDFGLARSLQELENKGTRVRGTPAYMSPEQIMGGELGPPADMYQFGVTLYEVVTGRLPFTEGNMGFAHVHQEPPPVGSFAPDLSADVSRVIDRCLAKEPASRPSAEELVGVFEHVYANKKHVFDGQTRAMPVLYTTSAMKAVTPTLGSSPGMAFARTQPAFIQDEEEERRRGGALGWGIAAALVVAALGLGVLWAAGGSGPADAPAQELASLGEGEPEVKVPVGAPTEDAVAAEDGDLLDAVERGSDAVEDGVEVAEKEAAPEPGDGAEAPSKAATKAEPTPKRSAAKGSREKVDDGARAPEGAVADAKDPEGVASAVGAEGDEVVDVVDVEPEVPAVVAKKVADVAPAEKEPKTKVDAVGASGGEESDAADKKKVRRVVRTKKVIRKKKTAVPRSF